MNRWVNGACWQLGTALTQFSSVLMAKACCTLFLTHFTFIGQYIMISWLLHVFLPELQLLKLQKF